MDVFKNEYEKMVYLAEAIQEELYQTDDYDMAMKLVQQLNYYKQQVRLSGEQELIQRIFRIQTDLLDTGIPVFIRYKEHQSMVRLFIVLGLVVGGFILLILMYFLSKLGLR